ncbi:MAG: GNAT family N-acetyltransferase [Rhodospirillales bacterium]|nr:GNAT family N-acetyltransferase [Rhodospirillales bacterium]
MNEARYPDDMEETVVLPDGASVLLRPIRPEDEKAHFDLLDHISMEDRRFRFFTAVGHMSHEDMIRFTDIDYAHEMAFVAVAETPDGGHPTLGVVRTVPDESCETAEFAIVVRSDLKHHGIGRALMRKAIDNCRKRGATRMIGLILPDNVEMLRFVKDMGFAVHFDLEEKAMIAELVLTDTSSS